MPEATESIRVEKGVLATYRYISERTGQDLSVLATEALRAFAKAMLIGANAALDGVAKPEKRP